MKYGFGVDLGGTTVKIAFFEENGTMLDKWEIPTNIENGGAAYRQQAGNFRGFTVHSNPFMSLCLCYLCNLFCCGGRFFFCC